MKTSEIPNSPKIKIENYAHKLSDKIRIILLEDSISRFIDGDSIKKLSVSYRKNRIKDYIREKRYPIKFVRELAKIKNVDIFKIIEGSEPIFFSKHKKIKLPKYMTSKLAYFIGYLQGDGSIESNEKRIDFTDESKEQIDRINDICFELFNVKGIIRCFVRDICKKPCYTLDVGSLVLNSYLHETFNMNRGFKKNLTIPEIITRNKEILRWYLVGLFDSDGTFPRDPLKCKQVFVDITMKDKEFIFDIKEKLKIFGIDTLEPYCRHSKSPHSNFISSLWELRIRRKENIIRFLKNIGFTHPYKVKGVKDYLEHVGQ